MSIDDPLRVLRTDDPPVQPDPAFAAALRARLRAALSLPHGTEEIVMSGTAEAIADLESRQPSPEQPRPAALERGADHAPCRSPRSIATR